MLQDQTLCAVYSADDNYAKYLGISMLSLFQSNRCFGTIEIFVLDCGIGEENRQRLTALAREYGRVIHFISMEEAVTGLNLNMGTRRIAIAAYARLFLASVIPESYDKILYLDCDTIIRDDIADLWNVEMEDCMVAGVKDTLDRFFIEIIGLGPEEAYVNSGVLLINLAGWREEHLEQQFMDFIRRFDGNVPHHDQGTINGVCVKKKYIVPPRYNVTSNLYSFSAKTIRRIYSMDSFYSQEELDEAKKNPVVLHFTTGLVGRPWEENCIHPMKEEYLRIAEISPWKAKKLLPDSRSFAVRVFSGFYYHMPRFISEQIYRSLCWLTHIRR